jgi:hypothetical protein
VGTTGRARRTRSLPAALAVALLALALLPTRSAAQVAEDASRYPFPASVRLAEGSASASYVHNALTGGPQNPSVTVALGDQARYAFIVAASRMFRPAAAGDTPLRLEVSVGRATITRRDWAWRTSVAHQVVAVAPDGAEVGRFAVTGEDHVVGLDQRAIPAAFARAAAHAAAAFEAAFDAAPEVKAWLVRTGQRPRIRPAPPAAAPSPPRPDWAAYVDAGLGAAKGIGLAARAGLAGRRFFAQVGVDRWSGTLGVDPPSDPEPQPASVDSWLVGAEAGVLRRVSERMEARVGAGVHWLSVTAVKHERASDGGAPLVLTIPKSGVVAALGGGLTYVTGPLGRWLGRGRVTLEVRLFYPYELRFDAFGRTMASPMGSAFLLVGGEHPVSF